VAINILALVIVFQSPEVSDMILPSPHSHLGLKGPGRILILSSQLSPSPKEIR
jgi:hypothetical protein